MPAMLRKNGPATKIAMALLKQQPSMYKKKNTKKDKVLDRESSYFIR